MMFVTFAIQTVAEKAPDAIQLAAESAVATGDVAQQSGDGASYLFLLLTIFALAVFLGVEIITKIPPTLHTPLMSGSNAISGITLIGAVLASGGDNGTLATGLGFAAVVFATMNVVGGFVVTNRMLAMFKTRK